MKPLQVKIVVAGINPDNSSFLAVADLYGTSWEDEYICTGIAVHMKALQLDRAVGRSKEEVIQAIADVWRAIKVKYVLSVGEVELLDVTADGIKKLDRLTIPAGYQVTEGTWDKEEIVMD